MRHEVDRISLGLQATATRTFVRVPRETMILMDSMCLCTEEMELYWELMERREAWKLKGNFSKCKRRMRIMQHNFIFSKD